MWRGQQPILPTPAQDMVEEAEMGLPDSTHRQPSGLAACQQPGSSPPLNVATWTEGSRRKRGNFLCWGTSDRICSIFFLNIFAK